MHGAQLSALEEREAIGLRHAVDAVREFDRAGVVAIERGEQRALNLFVASAHGVLQLENNT